MFYFAVPSVLPREEQGALFARLLQVYDVHGSHYLTN